MKFSNVVRELVCGVEGSEGMFFRRNTMRTFMLFSGHSLLR
jgi:hypothetical protein